MKDEPSKQETRETRLGEIYGDVQSITRIFSLFVALVLIGLIAGILIVLTTNSSLIAMILAIGILPVLGAAYLARTKRFETAAVFLSVFLLLINTVLSTKGLGIHSINNFAFPVILILASLVTSKRTMFFLTSLTVLCIAWLVFGELQGLYTPGVLVRSVPGDFFSASLIVILTAIMVYQLTGSLFRSFSQVQKEIVERRSIEDNLRQREAILEAVTFAAEQFLKMPAWRSNIDLVLERLGKTLNVTHAYLFEDHLSPEGEALTSMRYEWTAAGYQSDLDGRYFQNSRVDQKGFEDQTAALRRGDVRIGNKSTFTSIEKEDMDSLGVKSLLEVPVFVNGREWGAIGFDDFEQERVWTNAEVEALKIAAGVLGAAIQREIADSSLQESERIYRQAIEAAGAIPYYRDYVNHRYAFMGQGIADITGYSASEITPEIWKQLQLEGFPRGSMAHLTYEEADRLTEEGTLHHWECDYRMVNRYGQERWVADSCIQVLDDKNARIGVVGILQDVTERKVTEADLRKRESILEAIMFAAEQFLKTSNWRANIDVALEQLGRSLGVTHAYLFEHHLDADGTEVSSLRFEWTATGFRSDLNNPLFQDSHLLQEGVISTDEMLRHGEVFIGKSSTFPEIQKERLAELGVKAMVEMPLFVNDEWWGTIGIDDMLNERDWSSAEIDALRIAAGILSAAIQREIAESAVRESERIYRQAISAAGAVPYYRDYEENRYTFMGEGIERIIGYKPEEVTIDLWLSIMKENISLNDDGLGVPIDDTVMRSRTGAMKVWKSDMRVVARNGEERWVTDSTVELAGDANIPYASVGILQDVTDRKMTEAKLRKRESILEAITFAAEQFLKTSNWRDTIDVVLQRLGEEFNASHAYLFEKHIDAEGVARSSMINEWTAPGCVTDLGNPEFQNMPPKPMGFERMYEILDAGGPLIGSTSLLNDIERAYLHSMGVKSLLEMRVSVNGGQWGTIGFDDTLHDREWTSMEVDVIKVAANVLGAAIQRKLDEDALKRELSERQRAERALKFSEEKFSKAFHSTPTFKIIEDQDHNFIDVNQAFLDGFGLERSEVVGHNASELKLFIIPEDRAILQQATQANNGSLKNLEMRYRRKSGDTGYIILSSDRFFVDNVEYTLTTGLDITERKRAEQKYRDIFNNSIDGIFQSTDDGRFISVNPAMARIYGYDSPKDMLDSVNDIDKQIYVHSEQRNEIRQRLASGERLIGYETLDYRKDGSTFWASMSVQGIFDENGKVLYYEGNLEDISPRKKAEAEREALIRELAKKNAESETLRETTSIVTSTLDVKEAVKRILEQLKRVIPYDTASVWLYDGDVVRLVGSDGLSESFKNDMWYTANKTEPDYQFRSQNVSYILLEDVQEEYPQFREPPSDYIHGWLSVALKARGNLIGFISLDSREPGRFTELDAHLALNFANQAAVALENARLFSDLQKELEERKKLIDELARKNAELEQFTYTVSHDLKSPLVTINGFLGYLEQDALSGNTERLKKDTQRIQDAVYKMQRLLNELLELSRIGRMINAPETVSFNDLVREAMDIVHGRLEERGVTVQIHPHLSAVYVDRPRLVEVLQNLLDNAAKYMGDQRSPTIEIGQRGNETEQLVFFVKDNGIGIAPEHHERIFGLFNKLDARSEGTGVGLALVKRIIEVHGGRIWVESDPGMGATFLFTLPSKPKPDSVI
jgi:PAS domain S-box-containing protein